MCGPKLPSTDRSCRSSSRNAVPMRSIWKNAAERKKATFQENGNYYCRNEVPGISPVVRPVTRAAAPRAAMCLPMCPSQGELFGPFEAPMGFYIDGLRVKPLDEPHTSGVKESGDGDE